MLSCSVCVSVANLVRRLVRTAIGRSVTTRLILNLCARYNFSSPDSCSKIVAAHQDHFLYVLQETSLTGRQICERLDFCDLSAESDVFVGGTDGNFVRDQPGPSGSAFGELRIGHVTDVHYDLGYVVGSEADCKDVICCHTNRNESSAVVKRPAGRFGDYRCDTPKDTVLSLVSSLRQHSVDMVAFTGDMVAHDVWNGDRGRALMAEGRLARLLLDGIADVPLFPVVGNHEAVPANSFPYGNLTGKYGSARWLYSSLAMQWLNGFGDSARETFVKHGFYSESFKDYLIIGLNTNLAYLFNVWRLMYYPDPDPDGQLASLDEALGRAVESNQRVIILGHHPVGEPDLSKQWTRQFISIISNYSSSIKLMLFGHTHLDSFRVFRGEVGNVLPPILIAPSVATWHETDPCYRVLTLCADGTFTHKTYKMLLLNGTFKEEYRSDMDCSRFPSMAKCYLQYAETISMNSTVRDEFIRRYFKSSPTRMASCRQQCQRSIINKLVQ